LPKCNNNTVRLIKNDPTYTSRLLLIAFNYYAGHVYSSKIKRNVMVWRLSVCPVGILRDSLTRGHHATWSAYISDRQ